MTGLRACHWSGVYEMNGPQQQSSTTAWRRPRHLRRRRTVSPPMSLWLFYVSRQCLHSEGGKTWVTVLVCLNQYQTEPKQTEQEDPQKGFTTFSPDKFLIGNLKSSKVTQTLPGKVFCCSACFQHVIMVTCGPYWLHMDSTCGKSRLDFCIPQNDIDMTFLFYSTKWPSVLFSSIFFFFWLIRYGKKTYEIEIHLSLDNSNQTKICV